MMAMDLSEGSAAQLLQATAIMFRLASISSVVLVSYWKS